MVKITSILIILLATGFSSAAWSQSTESQHSGHRGGGSGGANNDIACIRAKITRFKPEHLSTVAPGAEFSFAASGVVSPNHIHVNIRQTPMLITVEDKDSFYLVKGHLPDDIKNTSVRITAKARAKVSKCDAEEGWLLHVGE